MAEMSSRRLYLGNLPRDVTKSDVESHFASHGQDLIAEVKLMNGFGFLEYKDPVVAADVVPAFNGTDFMGERLIVQFARGSERPPRYDYPARAPPRPRRTIHRMTLQGLPSDTSWQDLKDFARQPGLDVVFSEVGRGRDADGTGFVEYETAADLDAAVDKLDGQDFKGSAVRCIADTQSELPRSDPLPPRGGGRYRSRSPEGRGGYGGGRGGGYGGGYDDYDRRGPPPRYGSPPGRRDDYRRRSPPPRDYHDRRGNDYPPRSPPPRGDYPPHRGGGYDDEPYGGPPRRGYPPEPNGHGREPYGRGPSPPPRRERGYEGGGGGGGYDRPRY